MIKAAAAAGWLDERSAVLEALTAIKRAGADMVITYWAATWPNGNGRPGDNRAVGPPVRRGRTGHPRRRHQPRARVRSGGAPRSSWPAARAARLFDVDGNRYIDWRLLGAADPGHAHPHVVEAVTEAAARRDRFGAPTAVEVEMAEQLVRGRAVAWRWCGSCQLRHRGHHERDARWRAASTGRDKILKFDGCYHGHADSLLVKAGSGGATFGDPDTPGRAGGAGRS